MTNEKQDTLRALKVLREGDKSHHASTLDLCVEKITRALTNTTLIEKLRGMKRPVPHHLEAPQMYQGVTGYNTAIDDIIKMLEAE